MAVRIVRHALELIHILTDQNPVQVFVDAIINSGPREDSTRVGSAGVVRRQAVDVSPFRRVNQAIYLMAQVWYTVRLHNYLINEFFKKYFFLLKRVPVSPHSETSKPLRSACRMRLSTQPVALPTATPSRRRTRLSAWRKPIVNQVAFAIRVDAFSLRRCHANHVVKLNEIPNAAAFFLFFFMFNLVQVGKAEKKVPLLIDNTSFNPKYCSENSIRIQSVISK